MGGDPSQVWLFDVDNTLYPPSSGVSDQIVKNTHKVIVRASRDELERFFLS